ncbi:SLC13 family permease [Salibacterium salarium]|uniref:SLC13 family permease n=1 Tax=Salibacterium salarium TaxID=284579 RepID=A0A428N5P1_9BACI|nr:SLC13 family permease [Salibacterium salarium]RSL33628.1 SLC13 family permease [Salibacterium salarium]
MTWEMIVTVVVIMAMMVTLIKEFARPEYVLLSALFVLLLTGVLNPQEAVKGFFNQGMLTIGLLCIVAGAVQRSGMAERFIDYVLNKGKTPRDSLLRILIPSSIFSGVLNNTPIVAAFTPIVRQWCEKHDVAPSKFLLPISYATIAGGTMTLIGTSTNLVVHGMLVERGYEGFTFFQLAIIGVPITIVLITFMILVGMKMLPNRKPVMPYYSGETEQKQFSAEMVVNRNGGFAGQTLKQVGLHQENGIRLIGVIRNKKVQTEFSPYYILQEGDRLLLRGRIQEIAAMERKKGLGLVTGATYQLEGLRQGENRLLEVVVTHYSSILFKKIKDILFPQQFDAAILGVHRYQEPLEDRMKDITIKPGDTLLLLAGPDFEKRTSSRNEFTVLHGRDNPFKSLPSWKGLLPILLLVIMVFLATAEIISIFTAALLTAVLVLGLKIIPLREAKNYIPFQVLIVIAAALGIGEAMLKTGAATYIAETLIYWMTPFGLFGIFILMYILTNIFTEMITNNAAAIIMLPVSIETASLLDVSITPFAIIVAIAASASFMTPIGYQTNLFVYGQGGYRFADFMKVGVPVSLIVMSMTISITWLVWV